MKGSYKSAVPAYVLLKGQVGPTTNSEVVRDVILHVRDLPCTFGRAPDATGHLMIDDADSTLSREHMKIEWSDSDRCYRFWCMSKNGAVVNNARVKKGEFANVQSNSAIRMGCARLYVSLPTELVEGLAASASATDEEAHESSLSSPTTGKPAGTAVSAEPVTTANQSTQSKKRKASDLATVGGDSHQMAAAMDVSSDVRDVNEPLSKAAHVARTDKSEEVFVDATRTQPESSAVMTAKDGNESGGASGTPGASRTPGRAPVNTTELVKMAFASGQLPTSKGGGVEQAAILAWLVKEVDYFREEDITAGFKKAVYGVLNRKYDRVEPDPVAPGDEQRKKTPLLWAVRPAVIIL